MTFTVSAIDAVIEDLEGRLTEARDLRERLLVFQERHGQPTPVRSTKRDAAAKGGRRAKAAKAKPKGRDTTNPSLGGKRAAALESLLVKARPILAKEPTLSVAALARALGESQFRAKRALDAIRSSK